ncbi:hypothetical protein PMH41_004633 [Salmonella enterica]|nr:hypothetical protein [Salmonella enterica subsp. enterica serovar Chester]EKK2790655.1 hypothetical protein [Salmonella enterica]
MSATFGKNNRMIYGLKSPRDDWFSKKMDGVVDAGDMHIDGLSIEFKGVGQDAGLIVEIHGHLNSSQLRLLADAMEDTNR